MPYKKIDEYTNAQIADTLERANNVKKDAAALLNVPLTVLWRRCKREGIGITGSYANDKPRSKKDEGTIPFTDKEQGLYFESQGPEYTHEELTEDQSYKFDENGAVGVIEYNSSKFSSVAEAIDHAGLDRRVWLVKRVVVNGWDVTMKLKRTRVLDGERVITYDQPLKTQNKQVKVFLERTVPVDTEAAIRALIKEMPRGEYERINYRLPKEGEDELMYEVSLQDHHFGKLAWDDEVGENYDLDIAGKIYDAAVDELLDYVTTKKISMITFVVGHDLLHADGANNATTSGTVVDVDGRWPKAFIIATQKVIAAIEACRKVAPVYVPVVPGNHDRQRTFYLGVVLQHRFHDCKDVTIDVTPCPVRHLEWGLNLIGFCHGDKKLDPREKDLPLFMAQEWPEAWARTKYREWHLGHEHTERVTETTSTWDHMGVIMRRLPSLCGTDAWHKGQAFIGRKASIGLLWSKTKGPQAQFHVHMTPDQFDQ